MIRVVAYCRVSTDHEDQKNSFESQKRYFAEYIDRNPDWQLVGIYADEGITGTSINKRVEFNQMIQEALKGKVDLILTKEVSRFARNTVDALHFTRKLSEHGVGVLFINDNIDTRQTDGEFRLTIMASVAQEESRKTSERVKWGMYRQMERGYVMSNGVYGYHLNKGVLTVNEEEAQVVRLIFQKYLREHKGFKAIAKELIMSNISSGKRMREWNQKNIERILKNEKYIGDLLQKKTCTPNFLTHRSVINDGHEEKIYIRDNHDPIIDRDTWELTQIELKRRGLLKEEARGYSNRYWASGLLVCGECRTSVISRNKYNEDGSITRFWYCKNGYQYGKKKDIGNGKFLGCDSNLINDKALLTCVRYAVKEIGITSDELLSEIEKKLKQVQREESSSNLNGHRARIKTVREKKNNLIDHFMDGTLTKSDLKEMKERYDREIEVLEAKISREELELATFRVSKQKIGDILDRIRDIAAQEEPTKELYRDIIDRIILYNGHNIDIYFKFINSPVSLHYETIGRKSTYTTLCTLRKEEVV